MSVNTKLETFPPGMVNRKEYEVSLFAWAPPAFSLSYASGFRIIAIHICKKGQYQRFLEISSNPSGFKVYSLFFVPCPFVQKTTQIAYFLNSCLLLWAGGHNFPQPILLHCTESRSNSLNLFLLQSHLNCWQETSCPFSLKG
jgi:hypothetical protein